MKVKKISDGTIIEMSEATFQFNKKFFEKVIEEKPKKVKKSKKKEIEEINKELIDMKKEVKNESD